MSIASRIAARSRRPTATVRLGGRRWADVLTLSREQSYGQGISGGEVLGRNPPVTIVEGETTISWSWGYDNVEVAGFSGVVTKIVQRSYPNQWRLQVADPLWLADIRRSDIATDPINNVAASAAIAQILAAAGVSRLAIPALAASGSAWAGSEWVLGTLTPVSWENTTPLAAAQDICSVLGYWLYSDASGMVRATLMERRPSDSPFRTLRWGEDFVLAGTPERERDAATVRNRGVVKGGNTGVQGAQISDVWQTGAADRTHEFSSKLIEYVNESQAGAASCTGVAKRVLTVWGRQPNVIRIGRIRADPRAAVGQTWAIVCSPLNYNAPTPFFLYALSTRLDLRAGAFTQAMTLDGGTGDQGYTTIPPPAASFLWRIVREGLDGDAVVELFLNGTGSVSNTEGEIVSWAWSTATTTYGTTPDTATGPQAMFIYPGATATAVVTLTVTDTSSKTGAITQAIPLAGDDLVAVSERTIALALGSARAATPDGGQTWEVDATGDSTLVPEVSAGGYLFTTTGTGATNLARSSDNGATWEDLGSCGGTITALACTPDTERVWIAVGTTLLRSADSGATRETWGTLPASISAVLEDPALENSVFVLAGADLYQSAIAPTPGTTWFAIYTGPAGATARHLVRGESGATTWIAYTGTFTGSPLQRVEGPLSAVWPLDTDPAVAEVRAIALAPDELTLYAWDAQGRGWAVDSATGVAAAITATLAAGETAQHALHDPDDSIVYLATFGATAGTTYKYFPLTDFVAPFYVPASGQQAHRIGLAGTAERAGAGLLILPWGATGAQDRIWRYDPATATWTGAVPPQAGWFWGSVAANPFNPAEWVVIGNDDDDGVWHYGSVGANIRPASGDDEAVAYHTADAGATWTPITLSGGDMATSGTAFGFGAAAGRFVSWRSTGGWMIGGGWNFGSGGAGRVWRGSGASVAAVATLTTRAPVFPTGTTGGRGYAIGLSGSPTPTMRLVTIDEAGALAAPSGTINATSKLADLPGGGVVLISNDGTVYADAGVPSAQPASVGSVTGVAAGPWLAAAQHGVYTLGSGGGVVRIVGLPASVSATTVAPSTGAYRALAAGRLNRTALAALGASEVLVSLDGLAWQSIALPSGMDQTNTAGIIEVIEVAP